MLQLKRRDDITADDLPFIESALFACSKVENALTGPGSFPYIMGIEDVLAEERQHSYRAFSGHFDHHADLRRACTKLCEDINRYDVVLVGDRFNSPLSPVFCWQPAEGQPNGGNWEIQERIPSPSLQRLLRDVPASSHRIGGATVAHTEPAEPPAQAKTAAPRAALRDITLDVLAEHFQHLNGHITVKNGTRYTLTTDQNMVREGVVQNGRVAEKDLEMSSSYTLVFVKPT